MGIIIMIVLLILGFVIGRARERAHWNQLDDREAAVANVVIIDTDEPPPGLDPVHGELVMGSAVIGSDYLKQWLSGWRMLFGGELKSYQTVLSRARREANIRMVEEAWNLGARAVINVRYETVELRESGGGRPRLPGQVARNRCQQYTPANAVPTIHNTSNAMTDVSRPSSR